MPTKKKSVQPAPVEAAQPEVTTLKITRNGKTTEYRLELEYRSFVLAEQRTKHLNIPYSLLDTLAWSNPGPAQMQRLLFAALQKHHPDVTYEEACAIVDLKTFALVYESLAAAYVAAVEAAD